MHIPKTAGTSFKDILQSQFGPRLYLDYADRPLAPNYRWRMLRRHWQRDDRDMGASACDCIHGHFVADKYDFLGASARHVTWLRDPVQRVASHYHYWQRTPDLRNPDCRLLIERRLSLEEFAALPRMRNVSARFFGSKRPRDFFFIGLVEDLPASLLRFSRLTGIPVSAIDKSNSNVERVDDFYDMADVVRARIEQFNRRDSALYQSTLDLLGG
ncbi:MAG: hypothetical protein ABIQ70_03895 [Dokdonella sp.]